MIKSKKGFTIVELVIVIAVIAILAAVLIPTFSNVIEKSHQSACLQAAKSKFEEVYALDYSDGTVDGGTGTDVDDDVKEYLDENKLEAEKDADGKVTKVTTPGIVSYEVLSEEVKEGDKVLHEKGTIKFVYRDKNATATYYGDTTGWTVE